MLELVIVIGRPKAHQLAILSRNDVLQCEVNQLQLYTLVVSLTMDLLEEYVKLLIAHCHFCEEHLNDFVASSTRRHVTAKAGERFVGDFNAGFFMDLLSGDSSEIAILI